uniref:Uncharacterized protein n=1 Tax=Sphaeramia orbicularis TaxID=375764 RepID=A0A673B325_9TELE
MSSLLGPLYFSHKCRKHAYRLYHHTRGLHNTNFKRCARLLTRLAGSPSLAQRGSTHKVSYIYFFFFYINAL